MTFDNKSILENGISFDGVGFLEKKCDFDKGNGFDRFTTSTNGASFEELTILKI